MFKASIRPKLLAIAICAPLAASAFDISFFGRSPDTSGNRRLQVASGVTPNVTVVFDSTVADKVILRPALPNEHSNEVISVYRFEWLPDKSARFYELAIPSEIEKLSAQNSIDTSSPDGKAYEVKAIVGFFNGGKVLQNCLPPSKQFRGTITAYVVVNEQGVAEKTIVLPEGSIAECILESTAKNKYPAPAKRFTVKASVKITE